VRVDGVVDERPADAGAVQRQHDGPVAGATHGGPAQERAPIEGEPEHSLRLRGRARRPIKVCDLVLSGLSVLASCCFASQPWAGTLVMQVFAARLSMRNSSRQASIGGVSNADSVAVGSQHDDYAQNYTLEQHKHGSNAPTQYIGSCAAHPKRDALHERVRKDQPQ